MTLRSAIARLTNQEDLNFLLTNRIPRRALTLFMGWFSKVEQPLVRDASIAIWKLFSDLDLSEAKQQHFRSLHDCFTRELRDGARPVDSDPNVLCSPCDAIVGAHGTVSAGMVLQAKGFPYPLHDLLTDPDLAKSHEGGAYVTLRLTSSMYHRFHAPADCQVSRVTYISGDTWNVNPIALARVERLFCRNERAVIESTINGTGLRLTLVPVAAVLVASMRFHFANVLLNLRYRGANVINCQATLGKGQEMGWFEHGSTIIVFAPQGCTLAAHLDTGVRIKMGEPLLRLPTA